MADIIAPRLYELLSTLKLYLEGGLPRVDAEIALSQLEDLLEREPDPLGRMAVIMVRARLQET